MGSLFILQRAKTVLHYYSGNIIQALIHCFPEVEFKKDQFNIPRKSTFLNYFPSAFDSNILIIFSI